MFVDDSVDETTVVDEGVSDKDLTLTVLFDNSRGIGNVTFDGNRTNASLPSGNVVLTICDVKSGDKICNLGICLINCCNNDCEIG